MAPIDGAIGMKINLDLPQTTDVNISKAQPSKASGLGGVCSLRSKSAPTLYLREWLVKNQPSCSAWTKINVNFFDLADSTTQGDQLGRGLWILGSLGPPGQGPEVRGGHKRPFVTNVKTLVTQSFFAQMRSYLGQMMSPGLNFWNLVRKSGKVI